MARSSLTNVADSDALAARQIRTLLVANRGEIAVRIARTARRMGIGVIGIHAGGDRPPDTMDSVFQIGSYLDGEALVDVAASVGLGGHPPRLRVPGREPGLRRAVDRAGLAWVGPPAEAIAAMGDKAAARIARPRRAGVPTVPGYDGEAQDDATLAAEAGSIGYPVLIKPCAGGGGKGMRVVATAAELSEALAAARREGRRSFGDDRLILERYLEGSRHVEVQVLFDAHGARHPPRRARLHVQRRNQKIVEESPAPSVTPALRERLGEAAVAVASAVGYVSAGTVEFLSPMRATSSSSR